MSSSEAGISQSEGAAQVARTMQAADWFVRVSEDDLSDRELQEWLEWCTDPQNLNALQRIRVTSEAFEAARPEASAMLQEILAAEEAAERPGRHSLYMWRGLGGWRSALRSQAGVKIGAVAAGVAIVAGVLLSLRDAPLPAVQPVFESAGTNRSEVLPDGSTLVLAPRTRVVVNFDGHTRHLALSGGEAYFNVRQHPTQPFIVHAGSVGVTAIGTAFDVRLEQARIVVTVQEGTVALDSAAANAAGAVRWQVTAGHRISYDLQSRDAEVTAVDAEQALDWREGRLQYSDQPLGDVVEDVSRYTARAITVRDARLSGLRFTGTVFVNGIDDWLGALESTFHVSAVPEADGSVTLVPAADSRGSPPIR